MTGNAELVYSSEGQVVRNASKALTMPPFAPKSSSFRLDFSNPSIVDICDSVGDVYCLKGRNWHSSGRDKARKRAREERYAHRQTANYSLLKATSFHGSCSLSTRGTPTAQFDPMEACAVSKSRFGLNQVLCKAWRAAAHVKAPVRWHQHQLQLLRNHSWTRLQFASLLPRRMVIGRGSCDRNIGGPMVWNAKRLTGMLGGG